MYAHVRRCTSLLKRFVRKIHSKCVCMDVWRYTSACDHQKSILCIHGMGMQHQLNTSEEITIFKCITRGSTMNAPMSKRRRRRRRRTSSWIQQYYRTPSHRHHHCLPSTRPLRPVGKLKKNEHAIKLLDTISAYF